MEISVTYFSARIGASVLKFCAHLQEGKVYCVNEKKKDAKAHFALFSIFPSVTPIYHIWTFFVRVCSATT